MGRRNVVYHSLRLNLDNEQHRRVHTILSKLNLDIYKSVNQFFIDAADDYIKRLNGEETAKIKRGKTEEVKEVHYIRSDEMEQIRHQIKEELYEEMILLMGKALTSGQEYKTSVQQEEVKMSRMGVQEYSVKDLEADNTMIGLTDAWG